MYATVCLWSSEDKLQKLVLSTCGFWRSNLSLKTDSKYRYPLSHLTGPEGALI